MPLHVEIKANTKVISNIMIGRMDDLYSNTQVSKYVVRDEADYGLAGFFEHKYDEGAEICVAKALHTLVEARAARKNGGTK